jgi:hypothetical protein
MNVAMGYGIGDSSTKRKMDAARIHACYTPCMSEIAKKAAVETSPFEHVVAALMIVGKAELAEIMEAANKPRVGTKRSHKTGA